MTHDKPILVFGYGNISRGDDALGPWLLDFIQDRLQPENIELQTDFQLQIEHALDLVGKKLVLFIDASVGCTTAYEFTVLAPACDNSYTTHAMSPAAVLQVYRDIQKTAPPPSFLLSIKGEQFELGADLSPAAQSHLRQAQPFVERLLQQPTPEFWLRQCAKRPPDPTRH